MWKQYLGSSVMSTNNLQTVIGRVNKLESACYSVEQNLSNLETRINSQHGISSQLSSVWKRWNQLSQNEDNVKQLIESLQKIEKIWQSQLKINDNISKATSNVDTNFTFENMNNIEFLDFKKINVNQCMGICDDIGQCIEDIDSFLISMAYYKDNNNDNDNNNSNEQQCNIFEQLNKERECYLNEYFKFIQLSFMSIVGFSKNKIEIFDKRKLEMLLNKMNKIKQKEKEDRNQIIDKFVNFLDKLVCQSILNQLFEQESKMKKSNFCVAATRRYLLKKEKNEMKIELLCKDDNAFCEEIVTHNVTTLTSIVNQIEALLRVNEEEKHDNKENNSLFNK